MRFKDFWYTEYFAEAYQQLMFDFMKFPEVSWQEAQKLFGPVYHGTTEENKAWIEQHGFQVRIGQARTDDVRHGYETQDYSVRIPAPVHHLGYGIYFTTNKSIAKDYNQGTSKGLIEYYLDVPKLETINFGSPNTMMKWWRKNGYNMPPVTDFSNPEVEQQRVEATKNMTNVLKSQFDAVWFKGKGFTRLLDGDQICVFDPNKIYKINKEKDRQEQQIIPGDRFIIKGTNLSAKAVSIRPAHQGKYNYWNTVIGPTETYMSITGLKDPNGVIKQTYYNAMKKAILQNPEHIETVMRNANLSKEEALEVIINRQLSPEGLQNNFPSFLAGQILKKGERVPKVK